MAIYDCIQELTEDAREHVEGRFHGGEEFLLAVGRSRLGGRIYVYHIVTSERYIKANRELTSPALFDIQLSAITRVEYERTALSKAGEFTVTGPTFEESATFSGDDGQQFVDALREQIAKKETA